MNIVNNSNLFRLLICQKRAKILKYFEVVQNANCTAYIGPSCNLTYIVCLDHSPCVYP